MALIKCPECKKKISDQCNSCPNCGYPIGDYVEERNPETNFGVVDSLADNKTPIYKKIWFWVIIGVVVIAIIVTIILLVNRDTKPRHDADGNPVFVEFTSEVYTNADDYLGYYINIKGKVFQVIGDNGNAKGIQIWIDPDTCEQNLMIYYNTDVEVKQGDYIICSGYIDSVTKYKNAYDAELQVPLVYSSDLKKATYIDVMAPTIDTITPENLKQEQLGYSITIEKVEFAKLETRVYVTITNNGNASLNVGDAVIVQDGKQYNSKENYDADYEQLPNEIVKGVSCSGVIVFSPLSSNGFELTVDLRSDDYDEELGLFVLRVGSNEQGMQDAQPDNAGTEKPQDTKSKNEEAVERAEEIAGFYATVYPNMVKNLLIEDYSFTESQAIYAIQKANIDWNYYAVIHLEEYVGMNEGNASKIDAEKHLSIDKGYTDSAIEYAFANANVDWRTSEEKNNDKIPTNESAVGTYIGHSSECTFSLILYEDGTMVHKNDTIGLEIYHGTWTQQGSTISFVLQFQNFEEIEYYTSTLYTDGMQFMDFFYTRR